MAFELRSRMQKELDIVNMRIVQLNSDLKSAHEHNREYISMLQELEREMRRKGELEAALQIIGQFGRS